MAQLENSLLDPNNGDGLGTVLAEPSKDDELEGEKGRIHQALSKTTERIKKFTNDENERQA